MTPTPWSEEDFEAFIESSSSLATIREDDFYEGNFGFRQWRRLCAMYDLPGDGSIAAMATRLQAKRCSNLAATSGGSTTALQLMLHDENAGTIATMAARTQATQQSNLAAPSGGSKTCPQTSQHE